MSSVQNYEECPVCKGLYLVETDIKTQEVYKVCFTCGRIEKFELARDESNNIVFDENENAKYNHEIKDGYGVANFLYIGGRGSICAFCEKPNEERIEEFRPLFNDESVDKELSYMTLWDDEKKEVVSLIGPMPPTFEEFEKAQKKLEEQAH